MKDLNLKNLVQPLPSRSTPDLIAEILRQAIGQGLLDEGQSLRQDEIAGQLGVSRIPVREALRQLEVEGLVIFHPNRGAVVSVLSAAEAQEICEIRAVLEIMALELAIPQLRDADLSRAAELLKNSPQAADLATAGQTDLNWQFYMTLYAPAKRDRLLSLIKMLQVNIARYMRQIQLNPSAQAECLSQQQQLLDACWQRDQAAATQILRLHLDQAAAALAAFLKQRGSHYVSSGSGR